MVTREKFLAELQQQLSRHLIAYDSLSRKANNMLTVASIVATLLMGFNAIMFQKFNLAKIPELMIVIMIGILALLTSVILSVLSNRVVSQTFPIVSTAFFKDNKQNYQTLVSDFTDPEKEDDFYETFVEGYLDSLHDLEPKLDRKSNFIKYCEIAFFIGLASIPIIIGILFYHELTDGFASILNKS
jgi:hypothetical protein